MNHVAKVVSVLMGLSVMGLVGGAHADCSQDHDSAEDLASFLSATQSLKFCHTATSWAERSSDGWVGMCGDADGEPIGTVRDLAEERCDAFSQSMVEDFGMGERELGGHSGMWEACMRLAAGGPYDTTDGAFWSYWRDHQ